MLVALFALYAMHKFRREYAVARAAFERDGTHSVYLEQKTYTLYEKVEMLPIKNIAPHIPLRDVIWGVMPFVGLMFVAVFLICFFPGIATWLPDAVMGTK